MCNIFLTYNQLAAFGRFLRKNTGEYDGAKEGCAQLFYNWYEKDKMHEIKPMVWSALISGHLVKYQCLKEILSAKSKKIKMAQQVKHLFT